MSNFDDAISDLRARLDEGDRGDRGWWLITRVTITAARIQLIARYLADAGASSGALVLGEPHYRALGRLLGIGANPGLNIRRHYFLAMETPLGLLERPVPGRWTSVRLTTDGKALAIGADPVTIFERILRQIRFCREPWYSSTRVAEYDEFDVRPYRAILPIMEANGGYVDLDEFDLFISRIRDESEIDSASAQVTRFRRLSENEKIQLRREVELRVPPGEGSDERKPYHNWRDMARHTFSLFSLGTSAYRAGNELWLTKRLAADPLVTATTGGTGGRQQQSAAPQGPASRARPATVLQMPLDDAPAELRTPPTPGQVNDGAEAELLIGKMLTAAGWEVIYYNQRRGFGFDIWARKGARAYVIEVKSSVGQAGVIVLTDLELQAARQHRLNFLLVVVENCAETAPIIYVLQDPATRVEVRQRNAVRHTLRRADWINVAVRGIP